MRKIKDCPVLELCRQAQYQQGSELWQHWRKLPMYMELDAAAFDNSIEREGAGAEIHAIEAREGAVRASWWGPRLKQVAPPVQYMTQVKDIALLHGPSILPQRVLHPWYNLLCQTHASITRKCQTPRPHTPHPPHHLSTPPTLLLTVD